MSIFIMNRIGFACKYYHPDRTLAKKELSSIEEKFNTKTTTNKALQALSKEQQQAKLIGIINHNIDSIHNMLTFIKTRLPPPLHMYRISSDVLPLYTHPQYKWFWQSNEIQSLLEKQFFTLGLKVKELDILVSFHPGQFVVLASDKEDVVSRSIEEFEYHVDMARWMGFGTSFQDGCKINIHVGGALGPVGFMKAHQKLSVEARNLLSVENDEFSWGLDSILELRSQVALVLDIHHHWIHTGEYLSHLDDRVKLVIESWRGKVPTMHYSLSPEAVVDSNRLSKELPQLGTLIQGGLTKTALRAHSDAYWNAATNKWALTFFDKFNIMCEAKTKHNAALQLYSSYLNGSI